MTPLPFVIAGGGIGGLAAALVLARQGLTVQVLEQATRSARSALASNSGPTCFGCSSIWG
jgi:3-hydroxybenzoate 6-monooxygenase